MTASQLEPRTPDAVGAPDYEVAVIGAGPGGIAAAIRLKENGVRNFVVIERMSTLGGTWRDNTYPGISVDLPQPLYQYSFARSTTWTRMFPAGDEVQRYHESVAKRYGVLPHMMYDTEVVKEIWYDARHLWSLHTADGRVITARFVISAVGAFINPKDPEIPGLEDYQGKIQRPARWDHGWDHTGERVGIVGTGASAVQIIPSIAPEVGHLEVFQRTPAWCFPRPNIPIRGPLKIVVQKPVAAVVHGIGQVGMDAAQRGFTYVPEATAALPLRIFDGGSRFLYYNVVLRALVRNKKTRKKLAPNYGPVAKRPTFNTGYLPAFNRKNVHLNTTRIDRFTEKGIRTVDGTEYEFDMIVMATGHHIFCEPGSYNEGTFIGRDGFDLAVFFKSQGMQAYGAVAVPKMPNRWMLVGPYSWSGTGWHDLVENGANHAARAVKLAREKGATLMEVREDVHAVYHQRVRRQMRAVEVYFNNVNKHVPTYYRNSHGDMPYIRPGSVLGAKRHAKKFPAEDYRYETLAADASAAPRRLRAKAG